MASPTLSRILLVEDEDDIRLIATMALEQLGGLTVVACRSGAEALGCFPTAAADLVLLDVMMPGMDGLAVLAALRAMPGGALLPVVLMTAKVQAGEMAGYQAAGVLGVIVKPFDPLNLAAEVDSLWRTRKAPTA